MSEQSTRVAIAIVGLVAVFALFSGSDTSSLEDRIVELEMKLALVSDGKSSISVDGTVFANRFMLVDKEGNGRAEVGYGPNTDGNYGPGFWVYDIHDNDKLSAGLFQDVSHRTRLELFNAEDQKQAFFSFMANESPSNGTAVFKSEVIVNDFELSN